MSSFSFARQALKNWKNVGAIAPSSPRLGARMAEVAEVWRADRVVELGPGTGALTSPILDALPHASTYLGLELNGHFVHTLRQNHPSHRFENAAAQEFDFSTLWPDDPTFDVVISGLSTTCFPAFAQGDDSQPLPTGAFITSPAPGGFAISSIPVWSEWSPVGCSGATSPPPLSMSAGSRTGPEPPELSLKMPQTFANTLR
jgi:Methyltransferase domain